MPDDQPAGCSTAIAGLIGNIKPLDPQLALNGMRDRKGPPRILPITQSYYGNRDDTAPNAQRQLGIPDARQSIRAGSIHHNLL